MKQPVQSERHSFPAFGPSIPNECLRRVFVPFDDVETFDDRLPRSARGDVILYGFHEPEGERLTLFVGADEDRTKHVNLIVWHGVTPVSAVLITLFSFPSSGKHPRLPNHPVLIPATQLLLSAKR